jgi:ADP-ribose pyrophosphatase
MSYEIIDSKPIYHGKVFDVRVDRVKLPDNREMNIDIISHAGAVTILPVDKKGNILFIRQYRHAVGEEILELPAGVIDKDEPEEACALRELREETGMAARNMILLGEFYLAPGYSTEYMYVYFANDLSPAPLPQDEDEQIVVERIPVDKAYRMASQGEIRDSKTLAALLLAHSHFDY